MTRSQIYLLFISAVVLNLVVYMLLFIMPADWPPAILLAVLLGVYNTLSIAKLWGRIR